MGEKARTIYREGDVVQVLDQRRLPFHVEHVALRSLDDTAHAIKDMIVRGAPLIGVTAAYGIWIAARENRARTVIEMARGLREAARVLLATRPTAVNLAWAVERMQNAFRNADADLSPEEIVDLLRHEADRIADEDRETCRMIGEHGLAILREIADRKGSVNVLTHCNAGRLACVDYGTATAPIYLAHEAGIPVHVWVDETRPRLQGARLTAFELREAGIPHTIIVDSAAAQAMQRGLVDVAIVGCDRATRSGDVCNKIGTYPLALAARDNGVPLYVALPTSTIDWSIEDWREIPIEERSSDENFTIEGISNGLVAAVRIVPEGSAAINWAFDVTPARLVTGLITERGLADASNEGLANMAPAAGEAVIPDGNGLLKAES